MQSKKIKLIDEKGLRVDGRTWNQLRPIKMEVGVLKNADGSAYIEQGRNKIMVAIYGPRELHPKHLALPDRAAIRCRYHMAPFSTEVRKAPGPTRREIEISKVIREALEPVIFTKYYPRTAIDIYIEILESGGGTRCIGLTAASLALADAGIPLQDLVVACAVGKVDGQIVLDPNDVEDQYGEADMPFAMLPNRGEICLLQLNGSLTAEEFEEALNLAMEGCRQIYELQKEALREKYSSIQI